MGQLTPAKKVTIHTDGGCDPNPGPGGWAAVIRLGSHVKELSGGAPVTTNNRMELQAAIEALRALKQRVEVDLYTDSTYVRNGITEWLPNWKARGWRTAARKPVQNADLWRELDALASAHPVAWHWVRGHSGNPDNERCDQLAQAEIEKLYKSYGKAELKRLLADLRDAPQRLF